LFYFLFVDMLRPKKIKNLLKSVVATNSNPFVTNYVEIHIPP